MAASRSDAAKMEGKPNEHTGDALNSKRTTHSNTTDFSALVDSNPALKVAIDIKFLKTDLQESCLASLD